MKLILVAFTLLLQVSSSWASVKLQVGDVLLQPLKCWACSLIEAEEETIYSHIGVVLQTEPEVMVAEAFGKVRLVPIAEFDTKTEPGQELMVLRFRNEKLWDVFQNETDRLNQIFKEDFEGLKYDHDFRWNNLDENDEEKLYCSELVSKLIRAFVGLETPIKRMHFEKNREHWKTYFRGNIPDGQWGNSPGDFERSELFFQVGEL